MISFIDDDISGFVEVNHYDHSRMDHSFRGIYNCGYSCSRQYQELPK